MLVNLQIVRGWGNSSNTQFKVKEKPSHFKNMTATDILRT